MSTKTQFTVHVDGAPTMTFDNSMAALDYAGRHVYAGPLPTQAQRQHDVRNGKAVSYGYGFKTAQIIPTGMPEAERDRLLAAAPDLLAACKAALSNWGNRFDVTYTPRILGEAIAKAEGREK